MLQKITGRKPAKQWYLCGFETHGLFPSKLSESFLQPPLTTSYELYSIPEKLRFLIKSKKNSYTTPLPY